ncbi:MAG: hypothetical protein ABJZ55_20530 [Fuerstiella sp.]
MSSGNAVAYTDYMKVSKIAVAMGVGETTIRDFCRVAKVKPKYLLTTQMFSLTEVQRSLFDQSTKK